MCEGVHRTSCKMSTRKERIKALDESICVKGGDSHSPSPARSRLAATVLVSKLNSAMNWLTKRARNLCRPHFGLTSSQSVCERKE